MNNQKGFAPILVLICVLVLVGVSGGVYYFGKSQVKEPQPQSSTTVSPPSQSLKADETANWKTYSNKDLGYSIDIPPRWKLSDKLLIRDPSGTIEKFTFLSDKEIDQIFEQDAYNPSFYLEIETRPNSQDIPLKTWATETPYSPQSADQKIEDTSLNNQPAVKVLGNQGDGFVDYYLSKNGLVYDIGYYYLDNDPTWERPTGFSKELFDQILSTFKFLDQEQTSENQFCGGIAGKICPKGYACRYDGNYPDAGGRCVKE